MGKVNGDLREKKGGSKVDGWWSGSLRHSPSVSGMAEKKARNPANSHLNPFSLVGLIVPQLCSYLYEVVYVSNLSCK